jgi:hypothetical protein
MAKGRVVRRVDQMASANRRPGYPKRRQGLLEWTPSRKPNYKIPPGEGLDGYRLDKDNIILK